ncbi:hypothetical protein HPB47_022522 [Ixodes persulcatus]|uniref:Uncharacterized protein n=1 Tax=Ixodes persulcatus TaxID=34615 RepID=A0AC60Q9I1_IXOPE|nr:hypothetical protein HPB47_022522 [Ixodes persulcatus]
MKEKDIKMKEKTVENIIKGRDIYEPPRFMTASEAADQLLQILETKKEEGIPEGELAYSENSMCIGLARVGTETQQVVCASLRDMSSCDLGGPLHSLIVPGKLHPMELEMLKLFVVDQAWFDEACHGLGWKHPLMANNNIPAHDFAPSWLKIPSYDTAKNPQHSDGLHGNQREEHRSSFHRHVGGAPRPIFRERDGPPPVLHPGGDRGVALAPSGEEDLRLGPPALLGPPQGTATAPDKGLVPRRPHSRHDFRDLPQPAYHKLSPASNSSNHSAYPVGHVSGGGLGPGGSKKDLAGNNFNQEFPTLLGADQAPPQPPVVTSVWENPRNSKVHGTVLKKVHLVQRPLRNDSATLEARSKSPSSGVSSVVPAGTLSPKLARHPVVAVAPTSKAMPPSAQSSLYRALGPPAKKIQHVVQQQQQPAGGMHTMEVLVKHPKAKGNKGDFLKALRCGEDPKEGTKGAGDSPAPQ